MKDLHVPHFLVDWEHDRPPITGREDEAYRTSILIAFFPEEEAPYEPQTGQSEVARWLPVDNSIKMFGKCGHQEMDMPCKDVQHNRIDWNTPWGSMVMAHEIGHALGLSHDLPNCKTRGLMQAVLKKELIFPLLPEYCHLADVINDEKAACNKIQTSSDEHPCNDE